MKKTLLSIWAMLLMGMPAFAQIGGIEDSVNDISDTIRTIFPLLLGVIFLVGFLFNAGHFFWGERRPQKRHHTRIGIRAHCRGRGRYLHLSHWNRGLIF